MMPEAGLHTVIQAGFPFGHQLLAMKLQTTFYRFLGGGGGGGGAAGLWLVVCLLIPSFT